MSWFSSVQSHYSLLKRTYLRAIPAQGDWPGRLAASGALHICNSAQSCGCMADSDAEAG